MSVFSSNLTAFLRWFAATAGVAASRARLTLSVARAALPDAVSAMSHAAFAGAAWAPATDEVRSIAPTVRYFVADRAIMIS